MINALVAETVGDDTANANLTETAKVQKSILADAVSEQNGRALPPGWVPRWFTFPASQYLSERAAALAERRSRISDIAE
ncbi:hypothetical protein [Parvularcula sp. IMCC14364]|uniref:hypothetical protein n=1 Tax=Parvularcula sp. IMCC14364 TaxID=3067902 RepID=UPI0027420B7C|nr:hypothetical protein [Parvularcula sp. IMCC14364]